MTGAVPGRLPGAGGVEIYWQLWPAPQEPPRAVVAISHGAGEHSGRYEHVAGRLLRDGHAVLALDHRGHGRSAGHRALITRAADAVADLHGLMGEAERLYPGVARFLLGHSMGATLALRYAAEHGDGLAAGITVPTLLLYGEADGLCPPEGSEMLAGRLGAEDLVVRAYPGLHHEILNEPERDQVLEDVCAWLRDRTGSR